MDRSGPLCFSGGIARSPGKDLSTVSLPSSTLSSRRKKRRRKKEKKKRKNSHQSFKVGQETGSDESESTGRLHTELIDVILVRGGVVVEVVLWWRWDCLCGTAATTTTLG